MNNKKPIIGISTSSLYITDKPFAEHHRIYVNQGYVDAVIKAGGIPVMLPLTLSHETTDHLLDHVDGVILSGGQDVHPSFYKEEPHPLLGTTAVERDEYELNIIQTMSRANKPILGICRGMQLLNVAFGGTLYQDLSLNPMTKLSHSQSEKWDQATHRIDFIPHTLMRTIFGSEKTMANSFHHQAVKDLAAGFTVGAVSEDGVIEGIVKEGDGHWVVAVQWHPELMWETQPEMGRLFSALVAQAKVNRSSCGR